MSKHIPLVVIAVMFAVTGELLLKIAMNKFGVLSLDLKSIPQSMARLLKEPLIVSALAVYAISSFFWIAALSRLDLSYAYPLLSMTYVLVIIASRFVLNEVITPERYLGVGVICVGLVIIARSYRG